MRRKSLTIGICAYNEDQNIGHLLDTIGQQQLPRNVRLLEILVVASGCTDSTVPIVREAAKRDPRIRLFTERKRKGKVTAVNKILRQARGTIIIL
ncbi:MAG: glycosyltransferase, partial [bacterium]|nr:glycosyltransferase [bacterium]